jgi:hypothetical protein
MVEKISMDDNSLLFLANMESQRFTKFPLTMSVLYVYSNISSQQLKKKLHSNGFGVEPV